MTPKIIVEVSLPSRGQGGHVVGFVQTRRRRETLQNTYYLSQVSPQGAHRFLTDSDALAAVGSLTTFAPPRVKLIELE
ncbi:MAG: hypothetical protein RLZZ360_508 [Candidatus Parcubacteria bacterium]|jgi:hypothetical protein